MSVLKGLFQRHKVSLCHGFVLQRKAVMREGMLQLFPLTESHTFLKERPFATRLQSCFSEKAVCPLASDISYREATEGKQSETFEKIVLTTFSSLLLLHLTFSSKCGTSIFLCSSFRGHVSIISVSIHYPSSRPSQVFEQELAGTAKALFPTPNTEGLTEERRSSFDPSGRSGFS